MSDRLPPSTGEYPARRHRGRAAPTPGHASGLRALHLRLSVIPSAITALLGSVTVVVVLTVPLSSMASLVVSIGAAVAVVPVLAGAVFAATRATSRVEERLDVLRSAALRGTSELQHLVEKVRTGERVVPRSVEALSNEVTDPFALLEHDIARGQSAAQTTVVLVSQLARQAALAQQAPASEEEERPRDGHERQVEVFVNVARRLQSLVHREINLLDELEARVEDPDLLKGLFAIDLLATQVRRQSESLAVLGGASSGRGFSQPVGMYEVMRSAVAEVEAYPRVKVVPPNVGSLDGGAVVDVIHLMAELIENAGKFSPPPAEVMVRCSEVAAGAAIEVEDRGLGMPADEQRRMNALLANPDEVDIDELLRDGRIGLYVVAALARKHGARAQLQTNIYGGIQAIVVLPKALITPNRNVETRAPAQPASTPADGQATEPARPPAPAPAEPTSRASPPTGGGGAGASDAPPPARHAPAPQAAQPSARTAPAPTTSPTHPAPKNNDQRPPLPQRQAQRHMAPQLRDAPEARDDAADSAHTPGLMAAFQSGFSRAEKEDASAPGHGTDTTS